MNELTGAYWPPLDDHLDVPVLPVVEQAKRLAVLLRVLVNVDIDVLLVADATGFLTVSRAERSAGNRRAAMIAMIAITNRSSISVKQ